MNDYALRNWLNRQPRWMRGIIALPLLILAAPLVAILCAVSWMGDKADRMLYKLNNL